jgi:hypothetical protein
MSGEAPLPTGELTDRTRELAKRERAAAESVAVATARAGVAAKPARGAAAPIGVAAQPLSEAVKPSPVDANSALGADGFVQDTAEAAPWAAKASRDAAELTRRVAERGWPASDGPRALGA